MMDRGYFLVLENKKRLLFKKNYIFGRGILLPLAAETRRCTRRMSAADRIDLLVRQDGVGPVEA